MHTQTHVQSRLFHERANKIELISRININRMVEFIRMQIYLCVFPRASGIFN